MTRSAEVRINAHLVDAEIGACLWAERSDKTYTDLDARDEITARLAHTAPVEVKAPASGA